MQNESILNIEYRIEVA